MAGQVVSSEFPRNMTHSEVGTVTHHKHFSCCYDILGANTRLETLDAVHVGGTAIFLKTGIPEKNKASSVVCSPTAAISLSSSAFQNLREVLKPTVYGQNIPCSAYISPLRRYVVSRY